MEPYIDPKTDKVFCSECDGEITNLTYFAKQQMKSSKQYKQKAAVSFAVKCKDCNKEERPKIVGKNKDIVCPSCNRSTKPKRAIQDYVTRETKDCRTRRLNIFGFTLC